MVDKKTFLMIWVKLGKVQYYKKKKRRKQCLCKPGSVSRASLLRRKPSAIYLLCKSPCTSSILPSIVTTVGRDALKRWYT